MNKTVLSIFTVLTIFIFGVSSPAYSQIGEVFFNPDSSSVTAGDTFVVTIEVDENLQDIHCFKLRIDFDRDAVTLIDVTEGPLLQASGGTYLFVTDTMGAYDLANCLLGAGLYADGPGTLATLQFQANTSRGISELVFLQSIFQDSNLDTLEVASIDGLIDIKVLYTCGDANSDSAVNVSDAVYIINYVFIGGDVPDPIESADANCDGSANVSDAVWIINYVFIGGNDPCDSNGDGSPDC
jgi:hypothetical protein